MKQSKMIKPIMFSALLAAMLMIGCSEDKTEPKTNPDSNQSEVQFEATDAPIDDANVQATFVTISEIWVDGEMISGFEKTTVELSALTSGNTEVLSNMKTEASSISEVKLILDYDYDDAGNSPGSYVLLEGGMKDKISSNSNEITLTQNSEFMLSENSINTIVLDFDLRKIVTSSGSDYELVSDAEMEAYVRAVATSEASMINGELDGANSISDTKAIIYLYHEGDFDLSQEIQGQGQSDVQFANAVSSTQADANGMFMLSFIEEGNYEIHAIQYKDENQDGSFEITASMQLQLGSTIDFSDVAVDGESNLNLDLEVVSFLPL